MFHLAWVHEELALRDVVNLPRQEAGRMEARGSAEIGSIVVSPAATADGPAAANFELAMTWYRRSAEGGFAPGMNNLGQMYLSGRGGRQDHDAAFRWHLAAARAGNPVGRMNVAIAYSAGHGVAPDAAEATLELLRERELISSAYVERWLPVRLRDGSEVEALTYVIEKTHVQYCGGMELEAQAQIIARARGGRGPNTEYLYNTVSHLAELGIEDAELDWLAKRVRHLETAQAKS